MVRPGSRFLFFAALLIAANVAAAPRDDDPPAGQSWWSNVRTADSREGYRVAGTIRGTYDYEATGDNRFRLDVSGTRARGDRVVVFHRYDADCHALSRQAHLSLDDYCDQITLSYRDEVVHLAFASVDANRRYAFDLKPDARTPGLWLAVAPNVPAPELQLQAGANSGGISFDWQMNTRERRHGQGGTLSAELLRGLDLSEVEASLPALGELLMTFNRYEFEFADLPREHPRYQPSPYELWAEESIDGGCIGFICFGPLGNGGGGNNNSNPCSPQSPNYNPAVCPHDLTVARWPISQRMKIQKVYNNRVIGTWWLENAGTGNFFVTVGSPGIDFMGFMTLVPLFSSTPITSLEDPMLTFNLCFRWDRTFYLPIVPNFILLPGETSFYGDEFFCPQSQYRPPGRYRLHVTVDPFNLLDSPGYEGNNIQSSLQWVHLKNYDQP